MIRTKTLLLLLSLLVLLSVSGYFGVRAYLRHVYLTKARENLLKWHSASWELDRVLDMFPGDLEALYLKAWSHRFRGEYEDAERCLQACEKEHYKAAEVELQRTLLRAARGEVDEVAGALLAAVADNHPDSTRMLEALSVGYTLTFEVDRIRYCLREWLKREPNCFRALCRLGSLERKARRLPEAVEAYEQALDQQDIPEIRLTVGELLLEMKEFAQARVHFEKAAWWQERQGEPPSLLLSLAKCDEGEGFPERALKRLEDDLHDYHPDHLGLLTEAGRLATLLGKLDQGEKWLRQAFEASPFERDILYPFIQCLERLGKHEEAKPLKDRLRQIEEDLGRLEQLHLQLLKSPRSVDLRVEIGKILLRNQQNQEGARWLESALLLDPQQAECHRLLVKHYSDKGEAERARFHEAALNRTNRTKN